jgi:type IV fimbrial biogenesis protein FimT
MRARGEAGFTLTEVMVVVTIVAILVAIGLPGFQSSLRSNRVATAINTLTASVALARSEAIRSPGGAWLCSSRDGTLCDGDWNDGWIVWIDANEHDGIAQPTGVGDEVIRRVQADGDIVISGSSPAGAGAATSIRFDRHGRVASGNAQRVFDIEPVDCPAGNELHRTLTLALNGRVATTKGACA